MLGLFWSRESRERGRSVQQKQKDKSQPRKPNTCSAPPTTVRVTLYAPTTSLCQKIVSARDRMSAERETDREVSGCWERRNDAGTDDWAGLRAARRWAGLCCAVCVRGIFSFGFPVSCCQQKWDLDRVFCQPLARSSKLIAVGWQTSKDVLRPGFAAGPAKHGEVTWLS